MYIRRNALIRFSGAAITRFIRIITGLPHSTPHSGARRPMRSLSSPAAVCAAARRRRVDARGDRARPGADRRKRSPSAGARAVFSSVGVLNGDLNHARRRHRQPTAVWRRGGWDIATIACRALSTGNEDDESQEGEWSSRAVHPRIDRPHLVIFSSPTPRTRMLAAAQVTTISSKQRPN